MKEQKPLNLVLRLDPGNTLKTQLVVFDGDREIGVLQAIRKIGWSVDAAEIYSVVSAEFTGVSIELAN